MKRLTFALTLLVVLAAIGPPALAIQRFGQTQFTQGFWGNKVEWVWAYDTCGNGQVVVWKTDSVVARAVELCTVAVAKTMDDTLAWGPNHRIRIDCMDPAGYSAACTAIVIGKDSAAIAQTETLTFAATTVADTLKFSVNTWSVVRSITWLGTGAADSFLVYGYPIKCVQRTTSAEDVNVAGVMYDSVVGQTGYSPSAVDGYGRLVVHGLIPTYLVAGTYRPGNYICTSTTTGKGALGTSPAVGTVLGKALYAGTAAGKYPIMVNTE